jgi:predicted dehydrogenase
MKKYQVGVVGYGWAATAHIAAVRGTTRGEVAAICSSRKLDAAEIAARCGREVRLYADYDELLRDPAIDAVSLCTLPSRHSDQAIRAAQAGKHLILEKPVALNIRDLRRVEAAVAKAKVRVCVCFECRYSSQFQATRALLDRGLLGKLHYAEVDYYHGIGPWYAQFRWNTRQTEGGSALLSAGCHALDALLLCVDSEPVEVFSYGARSKNKVLADYEYPSTSVTLVRFEDGSVGKCTASIDCLQPYYFHTHLVGSKGSLLDNRFHSDDLMKGHDTWSALGFKPLDSGDVSDHPYQTQFDAFFRALDEGREMPLTSLAEAARTHELIFAADRSAATGRPVQTARIPS